MLTILNVAVLRAFLFHERHSRGWIRKSLLHVFAISHQSNRVLHKIRHVPFYLFIFYSITRTHWIMSILSRDDSLDLNFWIIIPDHHGLQQVAAELVQPQTLRVVRWVIHFRHDLIHRRKPVEQTHCKRLASLQIQRRVQRHGLPGAVPVPLRDARHVGVPGDGDSVLQSECVARGEQIKVVQSVDRGREDSRLQVVRIPVIPDRLFVLDDHPPYIQTTTKDFDDYTREQNKIFWVSHLDLLTLLLAFHIHCFRCENRNS